MPALSNNKFHIEQKEPRGYKMLHVTYSYIRSNLQSDPPDHKQLAYWTRPNLHKNKVQV